ncbi:MAG: T9SS type A sorting domain-containing protein [Bacteroidetes bacterium]|nr:MAG: T9SS type A sorting domain-containing protein [Bacteroidota bacterium]
MSSIISAQRGLAAIAAGVLSFFLIAANPFSSGAPAGRTGAPGEGNCTFCHKGSLVNSGQGNVVINAPASSQPGVTYDFTVVVTDPIATRFGFEITAKTDGAVFVGEWILVEASGTRFAGTGTDYVTHNEPVFLTNSTAFLVRWKAPATDVGDITFFAAGNGATLGGSSGDLIYTSSIRVSAGGMVHSESENVIADFRITDVFPIPFTEYTTFKFDLAQPGFVKIEIFDITGREIYTASLGSFSAGSHSARLSSGNMPGGILLYKLIAGKESATGRIILIR